MPIDKRELSTTPEFIVILLFGFFFFSDLNIFSYFYPDLDIKHLKIKTFLPPLPSSEKTLIINLISLLFQSPRLQESSEDCSRLALKIHVSKVILTMTFSNIFLLNILSLILIATL